jgi:trehalose 6-phosphate phosphatase
VLCREIRMQSSQQLEVIHAFIFDMDGVLTETEKQHVRAWRHTFNEYFRDRSKKSNVKYAPFEISDYRKFVDGKPRYDGVRDFLKSRDIILPEGTKHDSPDRETVCGLGNRKDKYFDQILDNEGAEVYQSSIDFVRDMRERGLKTAVVSSDKNCGRVLNVTHIQNLFDERVDGNDLESMNMPGNPDPSMFLEAARRLDVDPKEAAIVEDALTGVEAGRRGGFGLVVGMAHGRDSEDLRKHGADVAVNDLRKLEPNGKISK